MKHLLDAMEEDIIESIGEVKEYELLVIRILICISISKFQTYSRKAKNNMFLMIFAGSGGVQQNTKNGGKREEY
jgi:hypothetical protein